MRISSSFSLLVLCGSLIFAWTASGQFQNVMGSFSGHFVSPDSGITSSLLPYIEQENRTFQGLMSIRRSTETVDFPIDGIIEASDICFINGREASTSPSQNQFR